MVAKISERGSSVLIVGAGLTGACLAWLAAKAGRQVSLVSVDRPASQTTALAPGVVHGLGPPGSLADWFHASDDELERAAATSRRGFELLQELLLGTGRPTDYRVHRHRLTPTTDIDPRALGDLVERMVRSGFSLRVEEEGARIHLLRDRDALISLRGLTFALLYRARDLGASLRLGITYRGFRREGGRGFVVGIGDQDEIYDRVYWAGGCTMPTEFRGAVFRSRTVLHQVFGTGRRKAAEILEAEGGDIFLVPGTRESDAITLVRTAEESAERVLSWPEIPAGWRDLLGGVRRQSLSQTQLALPATRVSDSDLFIPMPGFSGWPVVALLGTCADLV